jgi:hypothetical protein
MLKRNAAEANAGSRKELTKQARDQIIKLVIQFLLGMAVNLIGLPSQTAGAAKITTMVFLGLHLLVALGLGLGAFLTVRETIILGTKLVRLAWLGAASIGVSIASGILTMATESNWWSYLMAVGFITAFICYGTIYVRARANFSSYE